MICDNTSDVCPGTVLTCTCTVPSSALVWNVPGTIAFTGGDGVGAHNTEGMFFAIVTNDIGGNKESLLNYTADESLVNHDIQCEDGVGGTTNTTTITVTFPG